MAISCIWAWIIPHFYIKFQEYRLALEKVYSESAVSNTTHDSSSLEHSIKDDPSRKKALEATFRGSLWALAFISAIYVTSALIIGHLTCQPGENKILLTKPDAIAVGVGRMLSAGLLAYFSVEIPRWLGVSYSKVVGRYKEVAQAALAISYHELSVEVCWSLMGPFRVMYPFLLTYFCNESFRRVALSTMVGTAFGIVMVYCIWLGHTKLNFKKRTKIAIVLSVVISMSSAAAFSAGCWYLKTVWYSDSNQTDQNEVVVHCYAAVTFVVWLVFCGIAHWICYRLTKHKLAEARASREEVNDNVDDTSTMGVGDNATELTLDKFPLLPKARTDVEAFDEITLGNGKSSSLGFIEEERVDSSIWHTAKVHCYCQRRKNYKASRKKGWDLGLSIFKWTLWALVATWHISFTIVNIGASFQQTVVRNALNTTYETLYPDNYTTGAMCAWQEPSETADIRTFDSLQDVMDMNYTVIHCGECGSCSNWNDLSLQWTTRDHLARKAKSW